MSLLSMLFSNWWEGLKKPHHIFDQHFGLPLSSDDLPMSLVPYDTDVLVIKPRCRGFQRFQPYKRDVDCKSSVQTDKNKFHVTLDVQQFVPEEITVKVVGRNVVVEGKHEERQDEHGFISRQFVRKYLVPEQWNINKLKSSLSSDGVLIITAPREEPDPQSKNERVIKIQITGQPALRKNSNLTETLKENQIQKNSVSQKEQEQTVKVA